MTTSTNLPDPRRWWALFLLCTAQFLVILDASIVGIAMPALGRALGFDAAGLQWIFNAYVVAFGGLLLLGGRLADLFGPRRLFATGFVILTGASLLAGLATSGALLLIGRAIQGAGAALIAPAALSMVMSLFSARPAELRRALGFWGAAAAAGGTAGVFLGGVITEWLSWRWTFLINVPVGLLVLLVTTAWLPRGTRRHGSIDFAGAATVTSALALAVYAIVTANEPDSGMRTAVLLAASGALFVTFAVIQRRRQMPLVPFSIFRAPNLTAGNIVMALLGAAWIPMWFFLNMYLQEILGYGAFDSGLALLPMTLAIMVLMMMATERVVGRIGPKSALVLGLGLLGLALILFSRMPVGGSFASDVLVPSLLGAIGMSLAYIPAMITSTAAARPEDGGLASGLVNTTYQIGSAIGLALIVAVAGSRTSSLIEDGLERTAALNDGFSAGFAGAAVIAFVASAIAAVAIRVPGRPRQPFMIAVMLVALAACDRSDVHAMHDEHGSAPAHVHARADAAASSVPLDAAPTAQSMREQPKRPTKRPVPPPSPEVLDAAPNGSAGSATDHHHH